jgi:hypothetical protein
LGIGDAGQSQIWRRKACFAERIGEGGSNWREVIVLTCIEGRYVRLYQRLRSSRLCARRLHWFCGWCCVFSGGVFLPEAELMGRY